jgi:transposase
MQELASHSGAPSAETLVVSRNDDSGGTRFGKDTIMETTDARKYNQQKQCELRKQVIRFRMKGMTNKETAKLAGLSEAHSSTIWQKYQKGGLQAIKPGVRGRRHGQQRTLTEEQELALQELLVSNTPDNLTLPFALWSHEAVRLTIKHLYGLNIKAGTIANYLKRWGVTSRRATMRANDQDSQRLTQWLGSAYTEVDNRAKREKAEIHMCTETGVIGEEQFAKNFAPKGKQSINRRNAVKSDINMIAAISNQGKVRFMLYRERMTPMVLIRFMSRLVKDSERKIFLLFDNLRDLNNKAAEQWLKDNKSNIEVFSLSIPNRDEGKRNGTLPRGIQRDLTLFMPDVSKDLIPDDRPRVQLTNFGS